MLLYKEAVWQLCWGTTFVLFAVMSLGASICGDVETVHVQVKGIAPFVVSAFHFSHN